MAQRIVAGILLFLELAFWVVGLAGLAATHDQCAKAATQETCNNMLGFSWWIIFFQLFVILLMIVMSFMGGVLDRFATAMVATVAIVTTLLMYSSEYNSGLIVQYKKSPDVVSAARAAMAGTVVMAMLNLIYIWLLSDKTASLQPSMLGGPAPPQYPPAASPVSSVALSQQQHVMYMQSTPVSSMPAYMPPTPEQGLKTPSTGGVRM